MPRVPIEDKIARLQQLVAEHPDWGYRRLNNQLKVEFGEGLGTGTGRLTLPIKREALRQFQVLYPEVSQELLRGTTKSRNTRILSHAGFTNREIQELLSAVDPSGNPQPPIDLQSPAWLTTLANRRAWSDRIRGEYAISHNKFLTRQLYEQIIDLWYTKGRNRTPWDWIKLIYRPKLKIDFIAAAKRRAQKRIATLKKEFRKK